jgi:transposase
LALFASRQEPPARYPARAQAKVHAVVEYPPREPPAVVTHWPGRAMIKAMSLPLRTMQRIWTAYRLQPHRIRTFKRSTDPDFAANLDDVVGPYMNPPRHLIENFFCKLKEFKRIAIRRDKTDQSFAAVVYLSAAVIDTR